MGAEGATCTEHVQGQLTVVVEEKTEKELPKKPVPQITPEDRPVQKSFIATVENTGADPPPEM